VKKGVFFTVFRLRSENAVLGSIYGKALL